MGTLMSLLLAASALAGAVLAKIIADDFKEWSPALVRFFLNLAVRNLPEGDRERFSEEWASHVGDVPGNIGKLVVALGCVLAACKISFEPRAIQQRLMSVAVSVSMLVFQLPIICLAAIAIKLEDGGPILDYEMRMGQHGKPIKLFRFRTTVVPRGGRVSIAGDEDQTSVGRLLELFLLADLPLLLNMLVGDINFVGPTSVLHREEKPHSSTLLSRKPGVIGLRAQDKIPLDEYLRAKSSWLDIKLFVSRVLQGAVTATILGLAKLLDWLRR